MSIVRIVIFIIIESLSVFPITETSPSNAFTVDQFVGKWYVAGVILPVDSKSHSVTCFMMDIVKMNTIDQCFTQSLSFVIDDVLTKKVAFGKIIRSGIYIFIEGRGNVGYDVKSYNQGNELIICDKSGMHFHALLSRKASVPTETRTEFDLLALSSGRVADYLSHNGCSNRN